MPGINLLTKEQIEAKYGSTVDSAPTENSTNLVTSGGVFSAINTSSSIEEVTELPAVGDESKIYALKGAKYNSHYYGLSLYRYISEPMVNVYELVYDPTNSNTLSSLTYAGDNASFTKARGGNGEADLHEWADSDLYGAITPYHKIGNDYFTRFAKIYEKIWTDGDGKHHMQLATEPFDGARLHPAFYNGSTACDYCDVGSYLGSGSSSSISSVPNASIVVSQTRATFRTACANRGAGYRQETYWVRDLVNKLYLMIFGDWDSQQAIGYGYTYDSNSSKVNTASTGSGTTGVNYGMCTQGTYTPDSTKGKVQVKLFGIEDWWGNVRAFVDGYTAYNGHAYATTALSPVDSTTSGYTDLGTFPASFGGKPLAGKGTQDAFWFPASSSTGSESTGIPDNEYFPAQNTTYYLASSGGYWASGSAAGAFCFASNGDLSNSYVDIGSRLTHVE